MSLEGLACVAGAEGEVKWSARLFGAAEALEEAIRYRLVPQERAVIEPYRANVRSRLGGKAWEDEVAEGETIGLDQVVWYALSEERGSTPLSTTTSQPPVSSTPEHPAGLSPREVEVLGLVVEGLTSAQIAKELFLSPRTVETHLTSIYQKLGVNSRAAATRFALEHGLA